MTRFVSLPAAPVNTSPVPHLTSIHSRRGRGPYGNSSYRGNCGGYLIRDLIRYYQPRSVLDLMSGSGTCADVCQELQIPCQSMDLKNGQDAADPRSYELLNPVDFIWAHPPYWRMIRYNNHKNCLSNLPTLDAFLDRMQVILRVSQTVLRPRGKIAVLLGGYSDRGWYQPLPQLLVERALREGLWPAATEIIRFQHGSTSSRRRYDSSFIPGLHDTCVVYQVQTKRDEERKP
ncbi:hypothetical protein GYB59_01430 [bacterium]|nr:hypothetical protein [bacterium]